MTNTTATENGETQRPCVYFDVSVGGENGKSALILV